MPGDVLEAGRSRATINQSPFQQFPTYTLINLYCNLMSVFWLPLEEASVHCSQWHFEPYVSTATDAHKIVLWSRQTCSAGRNEDMIDANPAIKSGEATLYGTSALSKSFALLFTPSKLSRAKKN